MFKILFIFLLVAFLNAKSYELSDENLAKCDNQICKNILNHYANFMQKISTENFERKLELVNSYINTMRPRHDDYYNKNIDIWSTRAEFLRSAGGDCEEYAISKLKSLRDLGVKNQACLLVVKEKIIGGYHMVLALWKKQGSEPVILDNLSFKILPISARYDLEPKYCLMDGKYYRLKDNGKNLETLNIRMDAYEKYLQKEQSEKFWKR
ncbi:hypothetical protein LMG7974_00677 [Campylobacter majalis]|uniref:Transglutaminase-like cysteine proteinase n=1 Tax=Campylobacter majalis TaxID=2790656 RepID=A0ABM8Q4N4_9BACT|nr:transglutaminase-like cysteine peptidase [Campylobacter majalis]CAD7287794.1 hypothetical protein LMG7974_00677 [Campylobacter majalis]